VFNTPKMIQYFFYGHYKKETRSRNRKIAKTFAMLLKKVKKGSTSSESTLTLKSAISR